MQLTSRYELVGVGTPSTLPGALRQSCIWSSGDIFPSGEWSSTRGRWGGGQYAHSFICFQDTLNWGLVGDFTGYILSCFNSMNADQTDR